MKKFLFFWLLFLWGCAPQNIWFNPTRNFTQSQTDLDECQHSGGAPVTNRSPDREIEEPREESDPTAACMKARGYYLVDKKYADVYRNAE